MSTRSLAALAAALLGALAGCPSALAYPEMTRHGYMNCTSCHVSPSGGGTLTAYGRELSEELLSAWSRDGEEKPLWGLLNPPESVALGGDYRSVYVYRDTPAFRDGRFIQMQADAEAAVSWNRFTADASVGWDPQGGSVVSRRHYLLYRLTDELAVRAGKFQFDYGINSPNHIRVTRRALGLNDEGSETNNIELSYLGDSWSIYATGIAGRLGADPATPAENGASLAFDRHIADRHKVGLSYYHGGGSDAAGPAPASGPRDVFGPYAILGFSRDLYALTELDFQARGGAWGFAQDLRVGYEAIRGLHLYAAGEFARLDFANPASILESAGPGVLFYPRPHFEFALSWQKQRSFQIGADWTDYAYLMLHFYL